VVGEALMLVQRLKTEVQAVVVLAALLLVEMELLVKVMMVVMQIII